MIPLRLYRIWRNAREVVIPVASFTLSITVLIGWVLGVSWFLDQIGRTGRPVPPEARMPMRELPRDLNYELVPPRRDCIGPAINDEPRSRKERTWM